MEADVDGEAWLFSGDLIVLAAGINTPAILLRSSNERHSKARNRSEQVGRNLMNLQLSNPAKSVRSQQWPRAIPGDRRLLLGRQERPFSLDHIQAAGGILQDALFAESPPVLPGEQIDPDAGLERLACDPWRGGP